MENNKDNDKANSVDSIIFTLLLIGSFYYKHREYIDDKIKNPYYLVFIFGLAVLVYLVYFVVGHYMEKTINQINLWQHGVKADPKEKAISFPFTSFDLQAELDSFYLNKNNLDRTFIGLDASKPKKEAVSIPDIQRSQHLQILGMTGTGKTAGIFLPLIYQDALKNRPVIILDATGELSSIDQLNAMLGQIGRGGDLLLFSLVHKEQSCTYNPLYVGECDPQIIIDSFFNNFKDDNSFYRETAKTIFTNTFFVLHSLERPFTPMDVYAYLTNNACRLEINKQIKPSNQK